MTQLSVNVNKVATLRNARGGAEPSVVAAVRTCVEAGAPGITVHPRADARHITPQDVDDIAAFLAHRQAQGDPELRRQVVPLRGHVEFNIEGDPRPALIDMVLRVRPDQCTLVPVTPGEITSHAGWQADAAGARLADVIPRLQAAGIRVSVFIDPDEEAVRWARQIGADRVELYTEPFAKAFARSRAEGERSFATYAAAAELAHGLGLAVNAGHDLDLDNLTLFRRLPHLAEVSIGHALISRALWVGLDRAVKDYLQVICDL